MGEYASDDKLEWEKPYWVQQKTIKTAPACQQAKSGANFASEITNINEKADKKGIGWQKPVWAMGEPTLKSTAMKN